MHDQRQNWAAQSVRNCGHKSLCPFCTNNSTRKSVKAYTWDKDKNNVLLPFTTIATRNLKGDRLPLLFFTVPPFKKEEGKEEEGRGEATLDTQDHECATTSTHNRFDRTSRLYKCMGTSATQLFSNRNPSAPRFH